MNDLEATPDKPSIEASMQLLSVIKEEAEPMHAYSICPSQVPARGEDKENVRPPSNEKKRKGNFEEGGERKMRHLNPSSCERKAAETILTLKQRKAIEVKRVAGLSTEERALLIAKEERRQF